MDPTACSYAPPGEYIKDHTLIFHDGWWHLYSISGTEGFYHAFTGNSTRLGFTEVEWVPGAAFRAVRASALA